MKKNFKMSLPVGLAVVLFATTGCLNISKKAPAVEDGVTETKISGDDERVRPVVTLPDGKTMEVKSGEEGARLVVSDGEGKQLVEASFSGEKEEVLEVRETESGAASLERRVAGEIRERVVPSK